MKYLYPKQILFLHSQIMGLTNTRGGVRDHGLFESAVFRPQASFSGQDLYPDLFLKASALIQSLIRNHPFVDGNKRTGFEAMRLFLRINGYDLKTSEQMKYRFIMRIAKENMFGENQISEWIKLHSHSH